MAESKGIFTLFQKEEFLNYLEQATFGRSIRLVQNHHTYQPNYAGFQKHGAFPLLFAMRDYHINTNHWSEIGQNLTTFPDGTIALCRPIDTAPSCIKGANAHGIGIEHVGNFDTGGDVLTPAHKEAIVFANAALCKRFKLIPNTDTIVYHHWYDLRTGARTNGAGVTKTCPGTNFFGGNTVADAQQNFIPQIVSALQAISGSTTTQATPLRTGKVTATSLNVRSAPDTKGEVVGQLKQGTTVTIYYDLNGWSKISSTRNEWVSAKFLQ